MKKVFFTLSLFFIYSMSFASDWNFELEPFLGIRSGSQDEFVYTECSDGKTRKLSELNWDEKPLFTGGLNTAIYYKNFFIAAGIKTALPADCGTLYDSDWVNCELNLNNEEAYSLKTNYSESDCELKEFYEFSLSSGYKFNVSSEISITPFAGIDYTYYDFHASDGTGKYSTSYGFQSFYSEQAKDFYEQNGYYGSYELCDRDLNLLSLRLQRNVFFSWIGTKITVKPTEIFSFETTGAICPYAWIQSLDAHYTDKDESYARYYLDTMSDYFCAFKGSFTTSFRITEKSYITAGIRGTVSSTIKGTSEYHYGSSRNGSYTKLNTSSGCSFTNAELNIGYRFKF